MAFVISENRNIQRVKPLYRGTQAVWYILNAIEVVLLFRFVLRLLGANPEAGFTQFVYALSYPFVAPFLAVFNPSYVANATFEWTTLLAMLAYWVLAWGIVRLIVMGKPVSTVEAHEKLSRQDVEDDTTHTYTY
jgi:uncharacterized membrane protein YciS (DUF1049 family)